MVGAALPPRALRSRRVKRPQGAKPNKKDTLIARPNGVPARPETLDARKSPSG